MKQSYRFQLGRNALRETELHINRAILSIPTSEFRNRTTELHINLMRLIDDMQVHINKLNEEESK